MNGDYSQPVRARSAPLPARRGFTLVELLVVMGIIAVLAGLILGAVTGASFKSRVTSCSNNFRQWGIAVNVYASDDPRGRLPSFRMPLASFTGYKDLYPWFVGLEMGTNMEHVGVSPKLWFCPARPTELAAANWAFAQKHPGQSIVTGADLTEYWRIANPKRGFAVIELSWFVPRGFVDSEATYPNPANVRCRIQDGWPTRIDDKSAAIQPILTDSIGGVWNEKHTAIEKFFNGHEFPRFFPRNINALFVDGHVETRGVKKLQWQIETEGGDSVVIPY